MKTLLSFLAVVALFMTAPSSAEARVTVSLDFFYNNLEAYGSWQEVGDYGYCWRPHDVGSDWRPYSDGRWVYTDAGWTWDTDEPYGWAVYHYGRWLNVDSLGWIWVPGTEWGPGWVSWRHGSRYVGWAPLPPEAHFLRSIGFSVWVDDYYDIGPSSYCFVSERDFGSRHLRSVFIDRRENIRIISQTTNITNISYVNNVVHNEGPRYDVLARESTQPISRYTLDRRQSFDEDRGSVRPERLKPQVKGDSLSVFAPAFAGDSKSGPRKPAERVRNVEVNRGWKNAGSPDEIARTRDQLKSRVKVPDGLPPPRFEKGKAPSELDSKPATADRPPIPAEKPSKPKISKESAPPNRETALPVPGRKPSPTADRPPEEPNHVEKSKGPPAPRPRSEEQPKPPMKQKPRVENPVPQRSMPKPPEKRVEPKHEDPKPREAVKPQARPEAPGKAESAPPNKAKKKDKDHDKDKDR